MKIKTMEDTHRYGSSHDHHAQKDSISLMAFTAANVGHVHSNFHNTLRNDMKTTEEIKSAVLAYCEHLCPIDDKEFSFENQGMQCKIIGRHHHGIADFDIRETGCFQRRIYQIRSSDDGSWWNLYYIFLGLATRDAVAELEMNLAAAVAIAHEAQNNVDAERAKSAAKDDEIEAIKAENKRLRDALLDIEDDANAKAVLGEPLNTKSILMSARHGLGIDSDMIHPSDEPKPFNTENDK